MVIQESYPVQADDMTAAGDVSARIKRHMKRLGVPAAVMRRVSVCTYEAEINLVIHSDGGQIDFEIAEDRITVRAKDVGPPREMPFFCASGVKSARISSSSGASSM